MLTRTKPGTERSQPGPLTGAGLQSLAVPVGARLVHRRYAIALTTPAERYRDSPVYVANEMPTDEVRAWALGKPGFEELWIDRDHLGWITLAFSQEAEARQAELEEEFPDVGVVAVAVDLDDGRARSAPTPRH